jgi:hypothetical protein
MKEAKDQILRKLSIKVKERAHALSSTQKYKGEGLEENQLEMKS